MSKFKIISIYSPAPKSGKSTLGKILEEKGYTHVSFATPVKESLLHILKGMKVKNPEEYLWGKKKGDIIEYEIDYNNLDEKYVITCLNVVLDNLNVDKNALIISELSNYFYNELLADMDMYLSKIFSKPITGGYLMSYYATEFWRNVVDQNVWLNIAKITIDKLLEQGKKIYIDDMRFENEYDYLFSIDTIFVKLLRQSAKLEGRNEDSEGNLEDMYFNHIIENNGTLKELEEKCEKIFIT